MTLGLSLSDAWQVVLCVTLHAWRHYAVTLRQARLEGRNAKKLAGDAGWALRDSGDDSEEEEGEGEGEEDSDEEDYEDDGTIRITPAAQRRLSARVAALSAVSSPIHPPSPQPSPHPPLVHPLPPSTVLLP